MLVRLIAAVHMTATSAASVVIDRSAALDFLLRHRSPQDAAISNAAYERHVDNVIDAVHQRLYDEDLPFEILCEALLPFRCLDEPVDENDIVQVLPALARRARRLVAGVDTASEAALVLNQKVFEDLCVVFQPNMSPTFLSPKEVIDNGSASCSGLSLLLVACLRGVGIPARCAGVLAWDGGDGKSSGGNHVWVEVFVDQKWHFLGAAEPTELDQTWFAERLRASAERPPPRVFASVYGRPPCTRRAQSEVSSALEASAPEDPAAVEDDDPQQPAFSTRFPLPWRDANDEIWVPAVDVSSRYE